MSYPPTDECTQKSKPLARWLWTAIVLLTLIALAAVVHRGAALFAPLSVPGPGAAVDQVFLAHRGVTLAHIIVGMLYLLLAPFQFVTALRRRPGLHRTLGRITLIAGLATGGTALLMAYHTSIGGVNETAAVLLFDGLFLISLVMAWRMIRQGAVAAHREWMIRAFAIGLAVATIRPIVALFFIASRLNDWEPQAFFGTAFWIGFTLHLVAAQLWIDWTRPHAQPAASPA
jgi:uncharacterized membrane protein YozB (DUF420 family)